MKSFHRDSWLIVHFIQPCSSNTNFIIENTNIIVSAFNNTLYCKSKKEKKTNPIIFNSTRIKSKQFIKSGAAIVSSTTLIPTCAKDIKFLIRDTPLKLPNFLINKSYDKVHCFDDADVKQTIINILSQKLNHINKVHDIKTDEYEQLKKLFVKLQKKQLKKDLAHTKALKKMEQQMSEASSRYQVCCNMFC